MVVASFRLSTNHHLIVCRNFVCTPIGVHTTSVCCPYVPQLGYIRPSKDKPGEKARGIAGLRGFEGLHCIALALLPTLRAAPSTPISARVGCVVDHTLARTAGSVPRALLSTACGAQQVLVGVSLLATPPAFSALPCSAVPVYAPCSPGRVLHHGHIVKWHRRRPHQCCTHPTASVVGSAG